MKLLLTGASGQLGRELAASLAGLGIVVGVDREAQHPETRQIDLSDFEAVTALLDEVQPEAVVNAAAFTAVDEAENAGPVPFRINALLPDCLALWCARHDRLLLHYSTDYVFDGRARRPYREDDAVGPLNAYGASKLAGEWAIQASGCCHVVLRTSWLYSARGSNFVLTMLDLARRRQELNVVCDQFGCPTWARNLAQVSALVLNSALQSGSEACSRHILHYSDADATTWYDFARMIFEQAVALGLLPAMPRLTAIASAELPQRARRPAYSVLDTTAVRSAFGIEPSPLAESLRACLEDIAA